MSIAPDGKDWTWVIDRACPQCGFDASAQALVPGASTIPDLLSQNTSAWRQVLQRPDVRDRPRPEVWSPLEYACHVRDVHQVFDGRFAQMLDEAADPDGPLFANWDQDQAAIDGRYDAADPAEVATALARAAGEVTRRLATVQGAQWDRPGRRSNGSVFTVASLTRYYLHDVVHHCWDVGAC